MMGVLNQANLSWKVGKEVRHDVTGSLILSRISRPSSSFGSSSRAYTEGQTQSETEGEIKSERRGYDPREARVS